MINNGWDKKPPEVKQHVELAKVPKFEARDLPKIPRLVPKLPTTSKIRQMHQVIVPTIDRSAVEDAHNSFNDFNTFEPTSGERWTPDLEEIPRNPTESVNKNYINFQKSADKESTSTSKFDRFESENESESDEDELIHLAGKKLSSDSESDDEVGEKIEPEKIEKLPQKILEESEDESPAAKRQRLDDSLDEENLLLMEDVGLDDLDSDDGDEYQPPKKYQKKLPKPKIIEPTFGTSLDFPKLKFNIEKPMTIDEEFDRNTKIIMGNITKEIDDPFAKAREKFFPDFCVNFVNSEPCNNDKCNFKHEFLPMDSYQNYFESRTLAEIDEFYALCVNFPRLFSFFFSLFAELYTTKTKESQEIRESKMARLIMECERTPRMQSIGYQHIVTALEKTMPRYKALQLLIKHHESSDIADEILLQLVSEVGADLFRLLPYLESVQNRRTFPSHALDWILGVTVQFENPRLSMFCLNNLITRSLDQFRLLDKGKVAEFLNVQSYYLNMVKNQNYASKIETVLQKISKQSQRFH